MKIYLWSSSAVFAIAAMAGVLIIRESEVGGTVSDRRPVSFEAGHAVYTQYCASCHGANLEGQADWKRRLPTGRLPAPPHDASGHTWHHSDSVLVRITKEGPAAVVGNGYESDMPGFSSVLNDQQIRDVIDYIKSTWPERERTYQAQINRANSRER